MKPSCWGRPTYGTASVKATRTAEIRPAAVRPGELLAGNVIGIGAVGLGQLAVAGAGGLMLLAAIYLAIRVAGRVYGSALVRGGARVSWSTALRLEPAAPDRS